MYLQIANCVISLLSLSVFVFFCQIYLLSLLTWNQSLHWTAIISTSMNITCDWIKKTPKNPLPVIWNLSWPITRLWSRACFCMCLFVCVPLFFNPPPLHYFFLVCGKQMKNLGQRAASACSLKRTISARGRCCSSCAAGRARKRVDGTYSLGVEGAREGGEGTWGHSGHPSVSKPPAHSFTVT